MDLLRDRLYDIVVAIARVHDSVWAKNLAEGKPFSDKDLHFLVMGAFGLVVLLLCYGLFRLLARRGWVAVMAWLLALWVVLTFCFAIEVGQFKSNTGSMELEDIVYGMAGFLAMSAIVAAFCLLIWLLCLLVRALRKKKREKEP